MWVFAVVGVVMVIAGGMSSKKNIEDKFGDLTPLTRRMSEGTGVVPTSTSIIVLLGYLLIVVGIIGGIATL